MSTAVSGLWAALTHAPKRLAQLSLLPKISGTSHQRHCTPPARCPSPKWQRLGSNAQQPGCLTQYQARGRGYLPFLLDGWVGEWPSNKTVTKRKAVDVYNLHSVCILLLSDLPTITVLYLNGLLWDVCWLKTRSLVPGVPRWSSSCLIRVLC